jgi:hypothetical protein
LLAGLSADTVPSKKVPDLNAGLEYIDDHSRFRLLTNLCSFVTEASMTYLV